MRKCVNIYKSLFIKMYRKWPSSSKCCRRRVNVKC